MFDYYAVFDIESTGFDSEKDYLIEVACALATLSLKPSTLTVAEDFSSIVDLSKKITIAETITKITGIDNETMYLMGEPERIVCEELHSLLTRGSTLFISYSTHFSAGFIREMFRRNKMEMPRVAYLDLMTVAKDRKPFPHKFTDMCEFYDIPKEEGVQYTVMKDVHSLVDLFNVMSYDTDNLLEYVNKIGYMARYGIKGEPLGGAVYKPQYIDPFIEHSFLFSTTSV